MFVSSLCLKVFDRISLLVAQPAWSPRGLSLGKAMLFIFSCFAYCQCCAAPSKGFYDYWASVFIFDRHLYYLTAVFRREIQFSQVRFVPIFTPAWLLMARVTGCSWHCKCPCRVLGEGEYKFGYLVYACIWWMWYCLLLGAFICGFTWFVLFACSVLIFWGSSRGFCWLVLFAWWLNVMVNCSSKVSVIYRDA